MASPEIPSETSPSSDICVGGDVDSEAGKVYDIIFPAEEHSGRVLGNGAFDWDRKRSDLRLGSLNHFLCTQEYRNVQTSRTFASL